MQIRSSTSLRSDYNAISEEARVTHEPIYITKNGEGDMVVMNIEAFEMRDEMLRLRAKLEAAEESRLRGGQTYSLADSKKSVDLIYES
jgi:prevent-host-death family protein